MISNKKIKEKQYRIFDDIYRLVEFNETEKKIIDSPLFQRLRRIKQLGLAHLVFPGAMHTRFSHSIGTLAVAQRVVKALCLGKDEEKKLRIAALLHDVGHFPLSHTIEKVYSDERKILLKEFQKKKMFPEKTSDQPTRMPFPPPEGVKLHEEMSANMIKNSGITSILKDVNLFPGEISSIVIGQHENNLFNQLMHSEVDIDQMDYLVRDAKNSGITYGVCDIDYIISNMEGREYKNGNVLFYRFKALRALEHFLMSRYFYFTQILYHKTRSIIEHSAQKVYYAAIKGQLTVDDLIVPSYGAMVNLNKSSEWLKYDDNYFEKIVNIVATFNLEVQRALEQRPRLEF